MHLDVTSRCQQLSIHSWCHHVEDGKIIRSVEAAMGMFHLEIFCGWQKKWSPLSTVTSREQNKYQIGRRTINGILGRLHMWFTDNSLNSWRTRAMESTWRVAWAVYFDIWLNCTYHLHSWCIMWFVGRYKLHCCSLACSVAAATKETSWWFDFFAYCKTHTHTQQCRISRFFPCFRLPKTWMN